MSNTIEIYGTKITIPDYDGYVENWGTDIPTEQYWRKAELPDYFQDVEYDKDGNALLDSRQRDYALEQVRRCKEGFWFINNGIKTFITGKHYFYLQFWKLENDIYPEYRDTDRRYFLFLNHWENTPWCLGVVRGKKRREGATSQATSNLIYECIFFRNSFCGLTSKTEKDAKTAFTSMVAFGYRQLPVFLKPKQLNNKDSVSELVFAHKTVEVKGGKGSVIDTDTGHRSKIDFRAPGKNAYDSGRLSRLLADECFAKGTKILCSGLVFKNIEDISIGDVVIVEGGKEMVVGNTVKGKDEMFLVKQPHSKDYIVNSKHRLYLELRNNRRRNGVKKITPLEYAELGKYAKRTFLGVRSSGLDFEEKEVLVDPYLLGSWLGDGFSDNSRWIVNKDEDGEILEYLESYARENNYRVNRSKTKNSKCCERVTITNSNNRWRENKLKNDFIKINVINNKHIPKEYLLNSREVRLQLLAGIVDTDGHKSNNGVIEIAMSNLKLVEDISILCRSLGLSVSNIKKSKTNFLTNRYRIHISGELSYIPIKVSRKKFDGYKPVCLKRRNKVLIESIGIGDYYGITLIAINDDDRRLILEDFTLSMNCGKWPVEHPASEFLAIVSKTMIQGVKRVGFCELPSTVNELTKGGGAEFKKIWDDSDHFKNQRTVRRLVRYFTPAFDGYVGFIDKHGMSVIDPPNEEQYKYLCENFIGIGDLTEEDIKLGAKDYLLSKRVGLEGTSLEEEIRMNPFDEREMFMSALTGSIYNSFKINEQLDWLGWNTMTEKGNLVWEGGDKYYKQIEMPDGAFKTELNKLVWVKNDNGKYEKVIGWFPKVPNDVYERNGFFVPNSNYLVRIGADPFKYDKTKDNRKSNCAAYAYQMPDLINPNYPYSDMFVMRYVDRPSTTDLANEYVLMMAWYCGCKVLFERNVNHWKTYFQSKKCSGFLMWLADEVEPGIYTDGKGGVIQTMCDYTESYIEKDVSKVYFKDLLGEKSGWLGFDVGDTQKYDDAMGAGFALIAAKEKRHIKLEDNQRNIEDIMPFRKAV